VAKAGDTIHWTHKLTNNGPDHTSSSIHSNLTITGIAGWDNPAVEYDGGDTPAGSAPGVIRTISNYTTYTVKNTDAIGSWLCENVKFDPTNNSGGRQGSSAQSCVIVRGTPPPTPDSPADCNSANTSRNRIACAN